MKSNEMINQVKELLGMEATKIELATAKLENGTVIEAESFEAGKEIFIVTEDEKVALPVGDYTMEDGMILVVAEEGIIGEIKEAEAEEVEEETEATEEEVEAAEEEVEEVEAKYATKEELAEVKSMIEEIKALLEPKEEMSAEDLGNLMTEELAAQEKTELSETVEKVSHSPESKSEQVSHNLFSQKKTLTTRDRVLNKIANL